MNTIEAEGPSRKRFSGTRLLAALCALMLLAGVAPLYAISFFNHPYYDDFGFSGGAHAAWQATHSLSAVLDAAVTGSQAKRLQWQGTYTGTFLSNLQPAVFSENLYWLTTAFLLTAFLLCFGYLLATLLRGILRATIAQTICGVSLCLFLMTQFLPAANEAFFWFNGGIGNTFIYSLLALSLGLTVRLWLQPRGAVWRAAALAVLVTLLGGGSYGGGLFGLLIYAAVTVYAFKQKHPRRWVLLGLWAWFLMCFAYSMTAPGNAYRASLIGAHPSAAVAVAKSFYYGVALMGHSFTLPVAAVMVGLAPLLWNLARASRFSFRHTPWVLLGMACLYCAQLTPPLYAGVGMGDTRITDTYYFSFIVMLLMAEMLVLGTLARRMERQRETLPALTSRAVRGLTVGCACLFVIGCLGYQQDGDTLYGPMNMPAGSAAISILTGEARQYDRQMQAREALLNDASQPVVTLAPLTAVPRVFMPDLLIPDAVYDVRPTLCGYYGKDAILLEGGDAS